MTIKNQSRRFIPNHLSCGSGSADIAFLRFKTECYRAPAAGRDWPACDPVPDRLVKTPLCSLTHARAVRDRAAAVCLGLLRRFYGTAREAREALERVCNAYPAWQRDVNAWRDRVLSASFPHAPWLSWFSMLKEAVRYVRDAEHGASPFTVPRLNHPSFSFDPCC